MGTKNCPGDYDCYKNAEPDEPMFVLLARDLTAPEVVEAWADLRLRAIARGHKPESDMAMVKEAMLCAHHMRLWRRRAASTEEDK
jgi:hypothetical protein